MMRIIADENITDLLVEKLRSLGYHVTYIKESAKGSLDPPILAAATQAHELLVTNDKDFVSLYTIAATPTPVSCSCDLVS